ncbi:hypothetical protein DFH08DRAFT_815391 [Mycena albidolilacea]|uniref:Uncharacterized protein n=1 Tax=Mycena albidolilacea TaxID=1033008 RepID=A0AAD6ZN88_9AGAR|nr:hypothetical protein DFH08DRAFT_815391 [Mycena albidolilacea]
MVRFTAYHRRHTAPERRKVAHHNPRVDNCQPFGFLQHTPVLGPDKTPPSFLVLSRLRRLVRGERLSVLTAVLHSTGLSTTYREFLLLRPEPRAPGSSTPRHSATSSSDSNEESSESEIPTPKRRRTSRPQNPRHTSRPEMAEVTDEDDTFATADDPRNYDLEEEDLPIAADEWNYDPGLEPTPAAVPRNSKRHPLVMLDDPPLLVAHFLGFRLCPVAEITNTSCSSLVEEVVQKAAEDADDEEQLENALLWISKVFGQAGRCLGRKCRGDKGKGKGRAP